MTPELVRTWIRDHVEPVLGFTAQTVRIPADGTSDHVAVVDGDRDGAWTRLVVRSDEPHPVAGYDAGPRRNSVAVQAEILRGLAAAGLPVPPVLLSPAEPLLGRQAVVLEWMPGCSPRDVDCFAAGGYLGHLPATDRWVAARSVVRVLARLHDVDAGAAPAGLDLSPARLLDEIAAMLLHGRPDVGASRVLATLGRGGPVRWSSSGAVACWGDARLANVVFDGPVVGGMVDWEFAGAGAPEVDVAWLAVTCSYFRTLARHRSGVEVGRGFGRREIYSAYEELTGRRLRDIAWFEAQAALRLRGLATVVPRLAALDRRLGRSGLPTLRDHHRTVAALDPA